MRSPQGVVQVGLERGGLRLPSLLAGGGVRALRCRRPSSRYDGLGAIRPGRISSGGWTPCGAWLAGYREGTGRPSDSGVLQRLGSKES